MSTTVTYNANQYSVPAYNDTGYAQGAGNLSSYLVALATGSLTLSGGTFTLTADANFGANFGLVSLYYKSTTASIASAGQIRLAKTDSIQWRNNAGGGNLPLAIDGSDRLTFNGSVISAFGIPLPIADGGTNSTTALSNNRLIESLSGSIVESPTTVTSAGTNLILGTTNVNADFNGVGTSKNYVLGYSSNNTNVQTDLGAVIRNASTTANSTTGLHFSAASGSTGSNDFPIFASLVASAATRTSNQYPVGTLHFLLTQSANTAPTEAMTLLPAGTLAILATTNQLTLGTTNTTTLSATAPSASRTYTIPDAGGAANVMLDKGNYTISGTWTSPTLVTPALGTPTSGTLTNCTGLPTTGITGTLISTQVFTTGSGTYTTPANVKWIRIRMVGGGGGGGSGGQTNTAGASGADGADTTFSTLTAGKGIKGNYAYSGGGAGGSASGGNVANIAGGQADPSQAAIQISGTRGGSSHLGLGGYGGILGGGGGAGTGYGAGGGGGGAGGSGTASTSNGSGGGGGGYIEHIIVGPAANYSYAVGAHGAGNTAAGANAGGNGSDGIIIVEEYYV